jgi:hypothetical protein
MTQSASFVQSSPIRHRVGTEDELFVPVSVRTALTLRSVAGSLGKALSVIFGSHDSDCGIVTNQIVPDGEVKVDGDQKPLMHFTRTITAIDPELAKFREESRGAAVKEALEALLDDKNALALATIVIECMRGRYPRKEARPTPEEFLEQTQLPEFIQMLSGVMQANTGVLGPLGAAVAAKVKAAVASATATEQPTETAT